ncbi:MAG: guanylate kinase [Oscillospiraceae bacterium]|nr:guanylate kinase [Oscillospiraceae bacterium]MDD6082447.1 guanylate kinase [Oscillospiraceae bacterium]
MNKGILIVVSAPSGCGKGTILAEVMKDEKFYYSVSATTRSPRPGETDGVNYHFLGREQFEELIKTGGMLEYAEYCGNYYGTPRDKVLEKINEGKNVILEIEVQGAMQIREKCPEAVFVFIAPPSVAELRNRLEKRGTETPEVINQRVSEAAQEISFAYRYDYVVVNNILEDAVNDFISVIRAEELKAENQKNIIDEVLKNA